MSIKNPNYKPRLSFDVREDQLLDLQRLLPTGVRRRLFEVVLDDLIGLLKESPEVIGGGLLSGRLKFTIDVKEDESGSAT